MANYTGDALAAVLFSSATLTAGAAGVGVDATGYVAASLGSGTGASPGWSPLTTARTGSGLKSFVDDWYGRLFVWPQRIDAGALQAPELYSLAVWNGYETSISLTSITATNADGVTTDGVVGETIGGLVSRSYAITISPTGDRSTLAGSLEFLYSGTYLFSLPVTGTEYGFWLEDDQAERCVLVEAQRYGGITHYLSTRGYLSRSGDSPSNQGYDELILAGMEVRSRIDGELVLGEIGIDNTDGSIDAWISYSWEGWPIAVYLGDMTWPRDAFVPLAIGTVEAIRAPSADRLAFSVRDNRRRMDVPVLTSRLSNGDPIPVCLGTVFNASPVWTGSSLVFQIHDGAVSSISALRDRGASCSKTDNLSAGTFSKTSSPVDRGGLTVDAIGATDGTAAGIVEWLALRAGLSTSDIDYTSLNAFPNTAKLGFYIDSERTCLECLDEVMESVGGAWRFSRTGLLQIFRLSAPGSSADLELTADDVEHNGISVLSIEPAQYAVRLGYQRNWTPQDKGSLAGSVSETNRDLYGKEYSVVEAISATVRTEYPLAEEPGLVGTLFVSQADAQTEATRRLALRATKRAVYSVRCFALPFSVQLGYTVRLTYPRFGFDAGETAIVIGMREYPGSDRVELELWR